MKKVLTTISLSLMLLLLVASVSVAAEQSVTVNPFGLLVGTLNGTYEKSLNNHNSFLIGGTFYSWTLSGDNVTALGASAGYRKYMGDEDFSGFFGQGAAGISFASAPEVSTTVFKVTGLVGYKWLFDQGFTVEAGIGGNYIIGELEGYASFGGFIPSILLSLGYSW